MFKLSLSLQATLGPLPAPGCTCPEDSGQCPEGSCCSSVAATQCRCGASPAGAGARAAAAPPAHWPSLHPSLQTRGRWPYPPRPSVAQEAHRGAGKQAVTSPQKRRPTHAQILSGRRPRHLQGKYKLKTKAPANLENCSLKVAAPRDSWIIQRAFRHVVGSEKAKTGRLFQVSHNPVEGPLWHACSQTVLWITHSSSKARWQ